MEIIVFALWFFLPAGFANMTPVFAARMPRLRKYNYPLDCYKTLNGLRIFGDHKTWRGIITGTLIGCLVFLLQQYLYKNYGWAENISSSVDYSSLPIIFGILMSFGALAGDAIKSFFKRRFSKQDGASWFPYDQLDYIIGGLAMSSIIIWLEPAQYLAITGLWFCMHLVFSYLGFKIKLKKTPI